MNSLSSVDLDSLSERELTGLVWREHYKNWRWFGPFGLILYYVAQLLGWFGAILAGLGLLQFVICGAEDIVALLLRIPVTVASPNGWRVVQLVILAFSAAYYSGLCYLMWNAIWN